MQNYILDACALLAFYNKEEGADVVVDLLAKAKQKEITIYINAVNLIEVYYDRIRVEGSEKADDIINGIYESFPISIIESNTPEIIREASYLKAVGRMSFADTILIATAICSNATVVTCDHVELEPVEQKGRVSFLWIRPQF